MSAGAGHSLSACSIVLMGLVFSAATPGCRAPSAANIALRKQVQTQQAEIDQLKRERRADAASLKAFQGTPGGGPSTSPALGVERTAALFTTHGVRLGRLTGAGSDGLSVRVVPTDDAGDDFKAAGAITVDAFDLAAAGRRVGHWAFTAADTRPMWNGQALRYEYVVPCPWQEPPAHADWTVKVTFVDALTGRSFDTQQVVRVRTE